MKDFNPKISSPCTFTKRGCVSFELTPPKKVLFEEVLNVMAQAMPQAPWFEICCSSGVFSYEAVDRLEAEPEEFSCLEKVAKHRSKPTPILFSIIFLGVHLIQWVIPTKQIAGKNSPSWQVKFTSFFKRNFGRAEKAPRFFESWSSWGDLMWNPGWWRSFAN